MDANIICHFGFRGGARGGLEAAPERGLGQVKPVILGPLTPGQVSGNIRQPVAPVARAA